MGSMPLPGTTLINMVDLLFIISISIVISIIIGFWMKKL